MEIHQMKHKWTASVPVDNLNFNKWPYAFACSPINSGHLEAREGLAAEVDSEVNCPDCQSIMGWWLLR